MPKDVNVGLGIPIGANANRFEGEFVFTVRIDGVVRRGKRKRFSRPGVTFNATKLGCSCRRTGQQRFRAE